MKIVLIGVTVLAVIALFIWLQRLWDARLKNAVEKLMGGRPRRSGREFGETFYPDNPEVAT